MKRRDFLRTTASTALAASALRSRLAPAAEDTPGYQGWIEVEYEGPGGLPRTPAPQRQPAAPLGEREGALATKRLLQRHLGAALRVKI